MIQNYSQEFDVGSYLIKGFGTSRLCGEEFTRFFFQKSVLSSISEFKVLDFGCGPVIANVISAARVATEVVLAEYTEEGRSAVRMWLEEDPNAFNWYLYFKYVVQTLEGGTAEAAEEREKRLRSTRRV